jgi:hypothetical protein
MENAGSVKTDASGRFEFKVEAEPQAPYLVQAVYEGVNYNKMLPPGTAANPTVVEIFDSAAKVPEAKLAEHIIFLQPSVDGISVQEFITFENSGNRTFNDPVNGTLKFFLPPQANGKVRVSVEGMQQMSLQREAEKTDQQNVYRVKHAIKPGTTRFTLQYMLPGGDLFKTKALYKEQVNLVAPAGVELNAKDLTQIGVHPQTQATLYRTSDPDIAVKIAGKVAAAAASAPAADSGEDNGGGIDVKNPLIYSRLTWILALALGMLALGFAFLYRRDEATEKAARR